MKELRCGEYTEQFTVTLYRHDIGKTKTKIYRFTDVII